MKPVITKTETDGGKIKLSCNYPGEAEGNQQSNIFIKRSNMYVKNVFAVHLSNRPKIQKYKRVIVIVYKGPVHLPGKLCTHRQEYFRGITFVAVLMMPRAIKFYLPLEKYFTSAVLVACMQLGYFFF